MRASHRPLAAPASPKRDCCAKSLTTSLFDDAEKHIAIVKLLANKPSGLASNEVQPPTTPTKVRSTWMRYLYPLLHPQLLPQLDGIAFQLVEAPEVIHGDVVAP